MKFMLLQFKLVILNNFFTMPELPEVETVRRYIKPKLIGKSIKSLKIPNYYYNVLENGSESTYSKFLIGKKIVDIIRKGKYIIFKLSTGFLLIHLRRTGKILLNKNDIKHIKYVSFNLKFTNNSELYFEDIRKFGRIYILNNLNWLEEKLGIEPLSTEFDANYLFINLQKHQRMIKPLLLDQKFIAGIGNIYADESLWKAGIHPQAISNKIKKVNAIKLTKAIKNILSKAISYNGTTIINFNYGKNKNGNFSKELQVFGKENIPCPNCNELIIKTIVAQRGTHYCKKCQNK